MKDHSYTDQPFDDFLEAFKSRLHHTLHNRADVNDLGAERGLPPFVLREILSTNPFSAFVPKDLGGRGGLASESMAVISAASYESLALSLMFGINYALFLQPFAKYGNEAAKPSVFDRVLGEQAMGGLMITEPECGSDALNVRTSHVRELDEYHIRGTKHWGGLTGWADYWLVTARATTEDGKLKRGLDFFLCDMNEPSQHIPVEEMYDSLGLFMIPYGRSNIDIRVPSVNKLEPESTSPRMLLDLLHRSRIQFGCMAMGFLQRVLDEALDHCNSRFVGGQSLFQLDQVQARLNRLQASYTICSAACTHGSDHGGLEYDLSGRGIEANSIKAVVTDLMQEASHSLLQLVGAKGYRQSHLAGRAIIDSRPFQIFEGPNDILYSQVALATLKSMERSGSSDLQAFLNAFELTTRASNRLKGLFSFHADAKLPQRKLVELGKALARVIVLEMVIELGERGYRAGLIENALISLEHEVRALLSTHQFADSSTVVEGYAEGSSWFSFASTE